MNVASKAQWDIRRFRHAPTYSLLLAALRLVRISRLAVALQRLERGERMILGIVWNRRQFEHRVGLARIRIDTEKQRVRGHPAEIDYAVQNRLRRVGNFG